MVRTQIYLTEQEQHALREMARQTGRTQSELIREAVDRFLENAAPADRLSKLREARGMWKSRCDLPDLGTLRRELDRVSESG